jgi:enoyl-CoA hydratase
VATFRIRRDGPVVLVEFDNPPFDVIDRRMVRELHTLVDGLERDPSARALVLTGFPRLYHVGEMRDQTARIPFVLPRLVGAVLYRCTAWTARLPGAAAILARTAAAGLLDLAAFTTLLRRLERLDRVVIAAIDGPALGAASELALACDLRYLADDVPAVGQPEVLHAALPGAGGTQRLSRALGRAAALEAILDGRFLEPREALALGYAHRVLPRERLVPEALAAAHRLADRPPLAVRRVKRAVYGY